MPYVETMERGQMPSRFRPHCALETYKTVPHTT